MFIDDASCKDRKIEVKIIRIITYDILPPHPPSALLVQSASHVWVGGGMILGGGGCFGGAVETAARTINFFDDSEFKMAVDEIKGKQTTINSLARRP
jgi:hypothetical protein